jgi:hypothetical protein
VGIRPIAASRSSSIVQTSATAEPEGLPIPGPALPITTPGLGGCASCQNGLLGSLAPVGHDDNLCHCGAGPCVPGRKPCHHCEAHNCFDRFWCALYECLCCPDPCYEPRWIAAANAAFMVDGARPVTQQRLRWDHARDMHFPDRAEYFWARADGLGPGPPPRPPFRGEIALDFDELVYYAEAARGGFSAFVEVPYRSIDPVLARDAAGFADMNLGTKSLIFDCELLQVTLQMRMFIPSGETFEGLGNGHMTLEPSLLVAIKLAPDTYLQGQISEWIPLGGDPTYEGAILHHHLSLNHVLYRLLPDVPVIGTAEYSGWSFQDGAYTDPVIGSFQKASNQTYAMLGCGFRLVVCDRVDFGVSAFFGLTDPQHFASEWYRSEIRWRY